MLNCRFMANDAPIPLSQWHCGSSQLTTLLSWGVLAKGCPVRNEEVNLCCAFHDDCYLLKLGKQNCDTTFCNCVADLVTAESSRDRCLSDFNSFSCLVVKNIGQSAYDSEFDDFNGILNYPIMYDAVLETFAKVYEVCHSIRSRLTIFGLSVASAGRRGSLACILNRTLGFPSSQTLLQI
ncbi:unnamed protein product [Caenorhabditis bovis]|uniref:Phospholipase A(2) n=1 Tax=Caenorhabditis bovis TaxID=2654633 RepID=A0A8S1ERE2_9PELO|nr:unnamed protein product [Caenorhabditis bovis]